MQVRDLMFKYLFISLSIIFLFSGCIRTNENINFSTREYQGVSKDALLNAAKRVIKLSDEDFTISSKRNSVNAIRAIPKNKGFTVDININELEFNATTTDDLTQAFLTIKKKDDIFSNNQTILKGDVHSLFWDRVEFILGLKKSWYSCTKYRLLGNFDGFFCDLKYNTNSYPTTSDIIQDITIQKPMLIVEDSINPTKIDLSSLEGILLPFKNQPVEIPVTLADLNTTGLFDLDIKQIRSSELNNTNPTDSNDTKIVVDDFNGTIMEYIEQPLPTEGNDSIIDTKLITPLENDDLNNTIKIDEANISIEENNTTKEDTNDTLSTIFSDIPTEQPKIDETTIEPKADDEVNVQNLSSFGKLFMESDPKHYTINLATLYTKEQSDEFIETHQIKDIVFPIGFINESDNKYYVKIMYGIFSRKADAQKALNELPNDIKSGGPMIENLKRKQDLFTKKGEDLSVK